MKIKKIILLFPILILFNCSLQKRKYQSGYFISLNKNINNLSIAKNEKQKEFNVQKKEIKYGDTSFEKDITVSANNKITKIFNNTIKYNIAFPDSCDEIIYKDGTEIKAKIIEINTSEIHYKRCNLIDGPTFIDKQNKVFMIKYANGKSKMFKKEIADKYYSGKIKENNQVNTIDKKINPITNPFLNSNYYSRSFSGRGFLIGLFAWFLGGVFREIGRKKTQKDSNKYNKSRKSTERVFLAIRTIFKILIGIVVIGIFMYLFFYF